MKRPTGVTVLGVLGIVGAVLLLLESIPLLRLSTLLSVAGTNVTTFLGSAAGIASALGITFGIVYLALAVAYLVFGIGALQVRPWAWMLGIISSIVALVVTVGEMFLVGLPVVLIINGLIALAILVYLYTAEVRTAFGHEPHAGTTTHKPMPSA